MTATHESERHTLQLSRRRLVLLSASAMSAASTGLLAPVPAVLAAQRPPAQVPGFSPASSAGRFAGLDDAVRTAMAQAGIPGAAVGVLADGEEYVAGFGVTNVEAPYVVDGDTLFQIGSITKTFTMAAIMRLVEQGKLDLDAPVRRYLPDLKLSRPRCDCPGQPVEPADTHQRPPGRRLLGHGSRRPGPG
jgi:CubicO group peptidase (beta-lactamase class C family)